MNHFSSNASNAPAFDRDLDMSDGIQSASTIPGHIGIIPNSPKSPTSPSHDIPRPLSNNQNGQDALEGSVSKTSVLKPKNTDQKEIKRDKEESKEDEAAYTERKTQEHKALTSAYESHKMKSNKRTLCLPPSAGKDTKSKFLKTNH